MHYYAMQVSRAGMANTPTGGSILETPHILSIFLLSSILNPHVRLARFNVRADVVVCKEERNTRKVL